MNCAVVELYSLADANGPGAQDQNLLAVGGDQLTLHVICGIVVGRLGRKLGGAGVHHLVGGNDAGGDAHIRDLLPAFSRQAGDLLIGKARALGLSQNLGIQSRLDLIFHGQDIFHAVEEVGLYACDPGDLLPLPSPLQGNVNGKDPLVCGLGQKGVQLLISPLGVLAGVSQLLVYVQRADGLLDGLLQASPNGHYLPRGLHGCGQALVGLDKFVKGPAGYLGHHIIDSRLEGGRRLLGHIIPDLV